MTITLLLRHGRNTKFRGSLLNEFKLFKPQTSENMNERHTETIQ